MGTSGRPDATQREAARLLDLRKRMREVEEAILARTPEHDLEPSLERIQAVMELLGDPQRTFPAIHLTGTNGKTSTARIIEAILRELGVKTGRFTSPHLHSIRERIAIAGEPITEEAFLAAYDEVIPFVEMVDARSAENDEPQMTYFEVVVAIAYAAFADAPIDVAVIEVGMGGSWDATNVIDADVSVLMPIDVDHVRFLGTTPAQIAAEKVGIISSGGFSISAAQPHDDVWELIRARAGELDARLATEGLDFGLLTREVAVGGQLISVRGIAAEYEDLLLNLFGPHQAHNATVAIAAVEAFLGGGTQPLDREVLLAALGAVESPGRLEIVRRSPTVIVDAAHNPHGVLALREALADSFTFTRLVGVVAILADKDAEVMLELLEPALDHIVLTRTTSVRASAPEDLGQIAAEIFGDHRVTVVRDLPDALDVAAGLADEGGVGGAVLATGSVITAAEVRMLLGVTDV
ncbi:MAG: folylpolyglutamate synthase/dihydrofolate synthase family protein [Actinomycetia bacterium]|nr:folylpolyglutamate synthase/dihydrofolate synthase family protein [Actinomycetes bacterium]